MLLGTLAASLLENILAGKGFIRVGESAKTRSKTRARSKKQGKGIVRAGHGNKA